MVIYLDTDIAVNSEILKDHPLPGPIILEYIFGAWETSILGKTYNRELYERPKVIKQMAVAQYWELIEKWRVPTQYQVFKWARDLVRHIIAMHESFNTPLGEIYDNPNWLFGALDAMTGFCKDFDPHKAAEDYTTVMRETEGAESEKVRAAITDFLGLFEQSKTKRFDIRNSNMEVIRGLAHQIAYNVRENLLPLFDKGQNVIEKFIGRAYKDRFYQDGLGGDTDSWLRYPSNYWAQSLKLIPESVTSVRMSTDPATLRPEQLAAIQEIVFYSYAPGSSQLNRVTDEYINHVDHNQITMAQANYIIPEIKQINIADLSEKHTIENFNLKQIQRILQDDSSEEGEPMVIDNEGTVVAPKKSTEDAKSDDKTSNQTLLLLAGAAVVCAIAFR